jgi:hypothetical protein
MQSQPSSDIQQEGWRSQQKSARVCDESNLIFPKRDRWHDDWTMRQTVPITKPRAPLRSFGQFPKLPRADRGSYESVPSLRDSDVNSHFTRHYAFGFVPGYDYSVPAALDALTR